MPRSGGEHERVAPSAVMRGSSTSPAAARAARHKIPVEPGIIRENFRIRLKNDCNIKKVDRESCQITGNSKRHKREFNFSNREFTGNRSDPHRRLPPRKVIRRNYDLRNKPKMCELALLRRDRESGGALGFASNVCVIICHNTADRRRVCSGGTSFDDLDPQAAAKAVTAIVRLALGNTTILKRIGTIAEYRIDWGPGYRMNAIPLARGSSEPILRLVTVTNRFRFALPKVSNGKSRDLIVSSVRRPCLGHLPQDPRSMIFHRR
jgi:hypothetical protein